MSAREKRHIALSLVGTVAVVALLWYSPHDTLLRALRYTGLSCQTCARIVGRWGMLAETKYHALLSRERLI